MSVFCTCLLAVGLWKKAAENSAFKQRKLCLFRRYDPETQSSSVKWGGSTHLPTDKADRVTKQGNGQPLLYKLLLSTLAWMDIIGKSPFTMERACLGSTSPEAGYHELLEGGQGSHKGLTHLLDLEPKFKRNIRKTP